ncbi:MAG: choice-of-anchor Q domain-containing protein [Chloroflexota bacterium]
MKAMSVIRRLFLIFALVATLLPPISPAIPAAAAGTTRFVKVGGTGDCLSWASACDLQAAITAAVAGDHIWVAAGSYKPGTGVSDTFTLRDGVAIYGGFAGTESLLSERNWATNFTVLSGDIDHNDTLDAHGVTTTLTGNNSYHVVTAPGILTSSAIVDGFTITGGHATYSSSDNGGGALVYGSPTLRNLIFTRNYGYFGGGMYVSGTGISPSLTNVVFRSNTALQYGGGVFVSSGSSPVLTNVTFSGNTAATGGGGGVSAASSTTMTNCILWGNSTPQIAGSASVTYSIVQGGVNDSTNHVYGGTEYDPDFVSSTDLSLQATSPAINAGNSAASGLAGISADLAHNSRFYGSAVDMGAYEYQGTPTNKPTHHTQQPQPRQPGHRRIRRHQPFLDGQPGRGRGR